MYKYSQLSLNTFARLRSVSGTLSNVPTVPLCSCCRARESIQMELWILTHF